MNAMKSGHCKLQATIALRTDRSQAEFARWLLGTMPQWSAPRYFSQSERLRRRPEFELANTGVLERYLARQSYYWFHANTFYISTGCSISGRVEVSMLSQEVAEAARLVREWIPALDEHGLHYATTGVPDEFAYWNQADYVLAENPGTVQHVWVGRNYERYVPGLYWLNYLSRELVTMHRVNVDRVRQLLGAEVHTLKNGYLVQIGESPERWAEHKDVVEDFVSSTPGFFSRRSVSVPEVVPMRELIGVIGRLGKLWP